MEGIHLFIIQFLPILSYFKKVITSRCCSFPNYLLGEHCNYFGNVLRHVDFDIILWIDSFQDSHVFFLSSL